MVDVSSEDMVTLLENSDYFQVIFEHGTIEAGSQTIHKPEWIMLNAEHIFFLICKSVTALKTASNVMNLIVVLNKVLLDTEIFGKYKGTNVLALYVERLWPAPHQWTLDLNYRVDMTK